MIEVHHQIPHPGALLGLVRAEGVHPDASTSALDQRLQPLLAQRQHPLSATEEATRQAVRDLVRYGRYRPTGRSKPASEYLLRSVQPNQEQPNATPGFPRINALVDTANYISLLALLPVSLWDLDRAATRRFIFRHGQAGESYVFNEGGQAIDVEDLIVGCGLYDPLAAHGTPLINPVKDSLATKTQANTRHVAACIYAPEAVVPAEALADLCETFAELLTQCGPQVAAAWQIARPGTTIGV